MLLHAFPLGARMWEPQAPLATRGWHVVMPQFRGFDTTEASPRQAASLDDYAQDVVDVLDELRVERAVVGGLSMGGYVALSLYRRVPERFAGLLLADTRAEADSDGSRANRRRLIDVAGASGASAIADEMLPTLLGDTTAATQPTLADRVRALILSNPVATIQAALGAMMTRADSTSLLTSISVPTLVVVGSEDRLTPPALSVAMAAAIPGAELVTVPRAGHLSNLEQPVLFNDAVVSFLERQA